MFQNQEIFKENSIHKKTTYNFSNGSDISYEN